MNSKVLNMPISSSRYAEVIKILDKQVKKKVSDKAFFLITAYSESCLEFDRDENFRKAVSEADLVVADGVSLWAAMDYLGDEKLSGIGTGLKILQGKYADRPTGVSVLRHYLVEHKSLNIFLYGGWGVVEKIANKYGCAWSEEDINGIEKINFVHPDILFVSLGRFKQEIWIAQNLNKIKAKVIIGVGSAFDEIAGAGNWQVPIPIWMEKSGLKWLWRGLHDAKHWKRIWNAVIIFSILVWRQKIMYTMGHDKGRETE